MSDPQLNEIIIDLVRSKMGDLDPQQILTNAEAMVAMETPLRMVGCPERAAERIFLRRKWIDDAGTITAYGVNMRLWDRSMNKRPPRRQLSPLARRGRAPTTAQLALLRGADICIANDRGIPGARVEFTS